MYCWSFKLWEKMIKNNNKNVGSDREFGSAELSQKFPTKNVRKVRFGWFLTMPEFGLSLIVMPHNLLLQCTIYPFLPHCEILVFYFDKQDCSV